jgi:hypothetical protein
MTRPSRLRPLRLLPALVLAGSLAGCGGGGLSRTFGFSRRSPDEFAVTTQPPLSMPPDYAIRAPEPGAPRPQTISASDTSFAKRLLFGGPDTGSTQLVNAPAEAARLRHNAALGENPTAGATPTIRPASGGWLSDLF